jgi:hypothetical protein
VLEGLLLLHQGRHDPSFASSSPPQLTDAIEEQVMVTGSDYDKRKWSSRDLDHLRHDLSRDDISAQLRRIFGGWGLDWGS